MDIRDVSVSKFRGRRAVALKECPHMRARCPHFDANACPPSTDCLFVQNTVRTATRTVASVKSVKLEDFGEAIRRAVEVTNSEAEEFLLDHIARRS